MITLILFYFLEYCDYIPLNKISITPACEYNDRGINCKQLLPPGTRVTINCAVGYARPENITVPDIIVCDRFGEWNAHPWQCNEVCGEVGYNIPNVVGGRETNVYEVPWQAAIYIYQETNRQYEFICGGSIISSKIVVSGE